MVESGGRSERDRRDRRWLDVAAVAPAMVAIGSFVTVALVHLRDNHFVDHVAGAWMALAAAADDGVLYPPLHDEGFFAGTRYGPVGILLNTAAAEVSGEYLTSGKVVALLTMSAVLWLVHLLARRAGATPVVALAAVGAVIANFTALFAGTTIYGDGLAVALQLGSIAVIGGRPDARGAAAAGALGALAVAAKFTGVWGLGAVGLWLLLRDRRRLVPFVSGAAATAAGVLSAATLLSRGRIWENLLSLSGADIDSISDLVVDVPSKAFDLLVGRAPGTLLLAPVAIGLVGLSCWRRRLSAVEIGFVLSMATTAVVLADTGTDFNHLLDVTVLVPLVVANQVPQIGPAAIRTTTIRTTFAALLAVATVLSLVDIRGEVREALLIVRDRQTPTELALPALGDVDLGEAYVTEDPTIAVERGDRPVVMDSYMLLRVLEDDPQLEAVLVERFEAREFDSVVLINDLRPDDAWWTDSHFGEPVARAIADNYAFERTVQGPVFAYRLYRPRAGP